ncbi:MAG: glycosyltransferase family 4 protein [Rhodocyclaceae bacterium]|nr:glycosyltransferase family 4 protein [Rhodocyclaceae bacterium]
MRITFFFENYVVGGGSKYVLDCVNSALLLTNDVQIVSNETAFTKDEIDSLKTPVVQSTLKLAERRAIAESLFGQAALSALFRRSLVFFSPIILLINVATIFVCLRKTKPDLLVSCNGGYPAAESSLAAVLAARLCKIPSFLVVMSLPTERRWFLIGFDRLLDFMVFRSAKHVIANSSLQLNSLAEMRSAPLKKLLRIYNGINDTRDCPRAVGIPTRKQAVLGVVCRLDKLKGLDFLIDSVNLLREKTYLIKLDIVGEGTERGNLLDQIARLGLGDNVKLLGHVPGDLGAVMGRMDVFVFPSLWEGLPYSILEALRAGLPIVSTHVGGIPEAIRSGVDGILVAPGSAAELADAIGRLIDDPDYAAQLGKNARMRYEQLFTLEKMHHDFCNAIRAVVQPKPMAVMESQ